MCFLRRLSCYVFFPLLELTTFFHAWGWGSRALEWGPGRLPDSLAAQTQCFHPLFSKNRLLNCAWSLVSDEQKWKSQSSGRNLQAVHQSLVFAYSSKYEDVYWITYFHILYIYFIRSSLQFIKIWSPLSCILIYPLYQCAFKFLCHELNIGQSHSLKWNPPTGSHMHGLGQIYGRDIVEKNALRPCLFCFNCPRGKNEHQRGRNTSIWVTSASKMLMLSQKTNTLQAFIRHKLT